MRLRKGLVVAQVMVSVLLLISAGLFIRSLRNLRTLDLGLKTENLIAFNLAPTLNGYTPLRTKQFDKQVLDRVSALPGVTASAFAQMGLLEGNEWDSSMSVEGYEAKPGENVNPFCNAVSPGYFKTMGIPLDCRTRLRRSRRAIRGRAIRKRRLAVVQSRDRQRELRETLLRRSQPDRPAHRVRHRTPARRRRSKSSAS